MMLPILECALALFRMLADATLDSPENPWRQIVIPLAHQYPHLMASILAFAAKHLHAITSPRSVAAGSDNHRTIMSAPSSNQFQQRATNLLAQEVQNLMAIDCSSSATGASSSFSQTRSNAILATMLVLCNVETVWPGEVSITSNTNSG
jgi:hypothetical protein